MKKNILLLMASALTIVGCSQSSKSPIKVKEHRVYPAARPDGYSLTSLPPVSTLTYDTTYTQATTYFTEVQISNLHEAEWNLNDTAYAQSSMLLTSLVVTFPKGTYLATNVTIQFEIPGNPIFGTAIVPAGVQNGSSVNVPLQNPALPIGTYQAADNGHGGMMLFVVMYSGYSRPSPSHPDGFPIVLSGIPVHVSVSGVRF